jgi:hypothetical protein
MDTEPKQRIDRNFSIGELLAYTTAWMVVFAILRYAFTDDLAASGWLVVLAAGAASALVGMVITFATHGRRAAIAGFVAGGFIWVVGFVWHVLSALNF